MALEPLEKRLLVAVGSRSDQICSVGSFARAEARALEQVFQSVEVLEPDSAGVFPRCHNVVRPDVIFFHAPALYDRKRPWNPLLSAVVLRRAFPKAKLISVVHEFSEAPAHWRARQLFLIRLSHGVIVNSDADFQGVKSWHAKVLRSRLGPTLFVPELLDAPGESARRAALAELIAKTRAWADSRFGIDASEKWLLHPGLLTPGKGINFLKQLAPVAGSDTRLIVMGGFGPKGRDREFANRTISELKEAFGQRFTLIESPSDEVFKQMLTASDLVVLPYDNGLSERRSSFLSAVSCGANVWTTTGRFSGMLNLENSGATAVDAQEWMTGSQKALESIAVAINEDSSRVFDRRMKNLEWAAERGWSARTQDVHKLIALIG